MKLSKIVLATISVAAFIGFSAQAETSNYYIQLNGGLARGLAPKQDMGDVKMGSSGIIGVEAGYKFNENLRASLSLDYLTNFSWTENVPTSLDVLRQDHSYKNKSFVGMLNVYYDILDYNGLTPYITVGAGFARNKATNNSTFYNTDNTVLETSNQNGKKTNFAYKIGLGAKYNVSQDIAIDLRYQFVNLGKMHLNSTTSVTYKEPIPSLSGKARAHQFLVGISYNF